MVVVGPSDTDPHAPIIKGMGFRGTPIYTTPSVDHVRMYIETGDGQLLYSAKSNTSWADLCKLKDTLFPSGFAVREVNHEVVQTTYKSVTVTEKKVSKKHRPSRKIRWP
jgi:hypothetical protein